MKVLFGGVMVKLLLRVCVGNMIRSGKKISKFLIGIVMFFLFLILSVSDIYFCS